jgi:Ca2+/Na+ antiporter
MRAMTNNTWVIGKFVFDKNGLRYTKNPSDKTKPFKAPINSFQLTDVEIVDAGIYEIKLVTPTNNLELRCLRLEDMNLVMGVLKKHVDKLNSLSAEEREIEEKNAKKRMKELELSVVDGAKNMMPDSNLPILAKSIQLTLLPIRYLFHLTIPDVHEQGEDHEEGKPHSKKYYLTIAACTMWLALLCYAMNFALETMGHLLNISPGAMGLTFGAAGTSIPNLFSSMIVARQGYGNMAVSNAFGSNLFCVYFVLGFGWWLVTLSMGHPYYGLEDNGIVLMVIILLIVLVFFLALLYANNWIMYKWMGHAFIVIYIGFLGYAFTL